MNAEFDVVAKDSRKLGTYYCSCFGVWKWNRRLKRCCDADYELQQGPSQDVTIDD